VKTGDLVIINDPLSFYAPEWRGAYAICLGAIKTKTMFNEPRLTYAFLLDGEVKILSIGFVNAVEVVSEINER
jgi:hypothetical protein